MTADVRKRILSAQSEDIVVPASRVREVLEPEKDAMLTRAAFELVTYEGIVAKQAEQIAGLTNEVRSLREALASAVTERVALRQPRVGTLRLQAAS